jgi:hypothetical protein
MTLRRSQLAATLILLSGCGGGSSDGTTAPPPPSASATFAGFVGDQEADGLPLAGAKVAVDGLTATATTGSDGRFTWPGSIPSGSHRVTVVASGYDTLTRNVTLQAGQNSSTFPLFPVLTYFASGNTLVYLPPGVPTIRGAFLVLYGGTGDSRPLLRGELDFYQNVPLAGDVAGYRTALRKFARERGFALVGMRTPATNESGVTVSNSVLQGLREASVKGGHAELADAPLLMQGLSTGACFVNRIVAAIPGRIIGFISMKSGAGCGFVAGSGVDEVPGYFFIGSTDTPEINAAVTNDFQTSRARGAVWAFAVEFNVGHTWVGNHALIFRWAEVVTAQRLPATTPPGTPVALRQVAETSGWLGDRVSLSISAYPCFPGDKSGASWLPSEQAARDWQSMMGSVRTVHGCPVDDR